MCVRICQCLSGYLFFFKQKTAYEMRISDWSSDVCSSDLFNIAWQRQRLMGGRKHFHVIGLAIGGVEAMEARPIPRSRADLVVIGFVLRIIPSDRKSTRLNSSH